MVTFTPTLTAELAKHYEGNTKISQRESYDVATFSELVVQVAKLSYLNKENLLFFRGQTKDYTNRNGNSSFYPTIYRGDYVPIAELRNKFAILNDACNRLVGRLEEENIEGFKDVKKRKLVQWSILQHYEVCDTPLLDFTHSLRVACSFAFMNNDSKHAFIYVFALPFLTNRISINSEQEIINIRLLSICPPSALRPFFQEGYLVGTEDITDNYESKTELDFNRRLVAKFRIPKNDQFWGSRFEMIPKLLLYPESDPMFEICEEIKRNSVKAFRTGDIGEFLGSWSRLEEWLGAQARNFGNQRSLSPLETLRILSRNKRINEGLLRTIDSLRRFRNKLVHQPLTVETREIAEYNTVLFDVLSELGLTADPDTI